MKKLEKSPEWINLKKHHRAISKVHLRALFADTPNRFEAFSIEAAGLFLDYSKNPIVPETMQLLCELARARLLPEKIYALFKGKPLNSTENQAALHTALRDLTHTPIQLNQKNICIEIDETLEKMGIYAEKIQQKKWLGCTGLPITDIVNIGIGGSDLGPKMVYEALSAFKSPAINCHFVSNADSQNISNVLEILDPATTLFIISSKSFSTKETLLNAKYAQKWFSEKAGNPQNHFLAVTASPQLAINLGIDPQHIFKLADFVGGRYSIWSAIGLPIALAMGIQHFKDFLAGAHEMDQHFISANLDRNMPVILALLGVWQINFFGSKTHAILPYCENLKKLPAYLQQAEMESNGKSVNHRGKPVHYDTCPVIWGEIGTNGQHAFHQLLHQGTQTVPADFILPLGKQITTEHQDLLVSSCFSQSQALMQGKTEQEAYDELLASGVSKKQAEQLAPHKTLIGNRPSNTLLFPELTPHSLGALLALYEHKIFVQSVIWDINSFDQWGVELGKQLADEILKMLKTNTLQEKLDDSTKNLILRYLSSYKRELT